MPGQSVLMEMPDVLMPILPNDMNERKMTSEEHEGNEGGGELPINNKKFDASTNNSGPILISASHSSLASQSSSATASPSAASVASNKVKKMSFASRVIRRLSSGSRRRSSDDSTASASSLDLTVVSTNGHGKPVRVPATIPEQTELTKEQLDDALRDEQIERAASARDEKRKRRVKEALNSMTRRFEAAYTVINAEMDENLEIARWSTKEKNLAIGICVAEIVLCLFGLLIHTMFAYCLAFIPLGMLVYSYKNFEHRSQDARQAADNVGSRLDDLEDGIRRCMLALQHDLEADAEWEASMKDEQQKWEERQKELQVKRGRTLRSLNNRRKKFVEQIRHQAAHLPEQLQHLPDVATQKARSFLEKKNFPYRPQRTRSMRASGSDGAEAAEIVTEPGASQAWIKYVHANLPLERLDHETDEEKEFIVGLRQRTDGRWDRVPFDLQLMVLRGYADKKDRLRESAEAVDYIVQWRAHVNADAMLDSASDEFKRFCAGWYSRFGGEDRYGHVIFYDRVMDLDLQSLFHFTDESLLRHRTQQMEVLRYKKNQTSEQTGLRVCKHIYILDLSGLSIGKHFTNRVKNLLSGIFKVGGDGYPDSLWSLWLINTPMVFQVIWKILSPTIDSVTKSKIRMVGGKDKYIPEMEKCGIPRSSIPKEFGGDFNSLPVYDALLEIIEDLKNRAAHSEQDEPSISAIPLVPDTSSMVAA